METEAQRFQLTETGANLWSGSFQIHIVLFAWMSECICLSAFQIIPELVGVWSSNENFDFDVTSEHHMMSSLKISIMYATDIWA